MGNLLRKISDIINRYVLLDLPGTAKNLTA
jgi:hypothetical protein